MLSGPLSNLLNAHWAPTTGMFVVGCLALVLSVGMRALLRGAQWA